MILILTITITVVIIIINIAVMVTYSEYLLLLRLVIIIISSLPVLLYLLLRAPDLRAAHRDVDPFLLALELADLLGSPSGA